jgi:hypothetical protein
MASALILPEPCNEIFPHAPHAFIVVNPYALAVVSTLSCPGWYPAPIVHEGDHPS